MGLTKVLVIGIDSACWDILDTMNLNDEFSFFKSIKKNSSYGDLESTSPALTCPAWKCYSTGKNPGKIGVFHWYNFNKETKSLELNNSLSFEGKEIWDYLSEMDMKCGVINMPLTYPPKKINGFMISGLHAFDWNEYTYPRELKKYLVKKFDYIVSVNPEYKNTIKILPQAKNIIKKEFEVCNDLAKSSDLDFLQNTIFVIDPIHHFHLGDKKGEEIIQELWKSIDTEINKIVTTLNPEILIVMSDHGITPIKAHLKINEWLEKEGYIIWKTEHREKEKLSINTLLNKLHINRDFICNLYSITPNILKKLIPDTLILKKTFGGGFVDEYGQHGIISSFGRIDWNKTKAIVIGEGLLYLFQDIIKKEEITNLMKKLNTIVNPNNNEKIFDIFSKDEIYWGKYKTKSPDFYLAPRKGYYVSDKISSNRSIIEIGKGRWKAYHQKEGLLLINGKGIKKDFRVNKAVIYDLAPTILHIFGLPIPNDIDGRVLKEIFEEGSELARRKPEYVGPAYYESSKKGQISNKINKLKKTGKI
ncbi:MAG: Type I phosphodiesterase / nucleotide pyrophosphatase [Candidatus Methanofastidiosum methylothiophilum]|uniref:Type I phosphodiesterase / nucleotide pyrophosphatase n=1 Tax=Candidatus Methanofastidiosum methylothiophilum TaxID=1705564 RepID=A0A150J8C8_9EURY|nr:MAG: Type I phosphodiesterase / nucleotide pyrophosphatase [Candidatus Methanofastidiosum methylthiophilus]